MKTISKTWKIFIIAITFTIIMCFCYWYTFRIIWQGSKKVFELTDKIETLVQKRGLLEFIKMEVNSTEAAREKIETYIIPKEGIVPFLNSIQTLSAKNQLTTKVVSVDIEQARTSPEIFEVVKVNLEVIGLWSNVYRFVALLELLPYKILMNRVDLTKAGAGGFGGSISKQVSSNSWKATVTMGVLKIK